MMTMLLSTALPSLHGVRVLSSVSYHDVAALE